MSTNNSNQSGNITLILMVVIGLIAGMYVYNRIENERKKAAIQAAEKAQEDAMIQQLMLRYKLLTGKETTYEEMRKFYRDMKSMGYR